MTKDPRRDCRNLEGIWGGPVRMGGGRREEEEGLELELLSQEPRQQQLG